MRDRREEHDARRGLAVVLLRQRVRDPVAQLLLERLEPGLRRRTTRCSRRTRRRRRPWCWCRRTGCPRSRRSAAASPLSHSSGVPKFFERRRVLISSPLNPRLRTTSSCFGNRACSIVSSQPSYCIRSASVLPMMLMWSFGCSANGCCRASTAPRLPPPAASTAARAPAPVPPNPLVSWSWCVSHDPFAVRRFGAASPTVRLIASLSLSRSALVRSPVTVLLLLRPSESACPSPPGRTASSPLTNPSKANVVGWIRADEADVAVGPDARLEPGGPQRRVDGHPPESVVQEILRRAVGRREDAARLAGRACW